MSFIFFPCHIALDVTSSKKLNKVLRVDVFCLISDQRGKQSFIHHYGDGYWFSVGACYEVEGNSTLLLKVFVTKEY